MEEKQLDFNAPLLSVRRLSSTLASSNGVKKKLTENSQPCRQHSLPLYKSDWELDEVTKPAAVPFHWEWIPGRAKDESELDHIKHEDSENQNVFWPPIESTPSNEKGINKKEDSGLESEDDAYSDAVDTLSQTESFSWNCSISCLSGYDDPDVKPSGTFSTDPKTRDFIMSRFLPAAKAMILETPIYVPRKQSAINEPPIHVKKAVSGELKPLLKQYGSNIISHYDPYIGNIESKDEDEDDNYDHLGKKSGKSCGFLPRLCVANSFCLLNPVPGLKSRTQAPISSAGEVRRVTRTAYSGPLPQTHEKHTWDAAYRKKSQCGVQSRELQDVENRIAGKSSRFNRSNDSFTTNGSSPYNRPRGGRISPYRNETPHSPFHNGARFLGIPKNVENDEPNKFSSTNKGCSQFLDVSPHHISEGPSSVNPVVEKTLYVDSVNNVKVPILNMGSSEAQVLKLEHDLDHEAGLLECRKPDPNGFLDKSNLDSIKADDQGNPNVLSFQSPLAPPLPKSPSESWLWRTIPSINPFSHRKQGSKTSTNGSKWETIVKTSHIHHDHVRYSEELIPRLSQHSKT